MVPPTHNEGMPLPLPRPSAVFDLTRAAVGQAVDTAGTLAAVPARAFAVLDSVETLVNRINGVVDRIESVLDRAERTVGAAERAVGQVAEITTAAKRAVGHVDEITAAAKAAVGQVGTITGAASATITEVTRIATAAGTVLADVEKVAGSAGVVVGAAETVAAKATDVVGRVEGTAGKADELLTTYGPTLHKAAPMAVRFVEQLSPEEVDAAIRLVDELPRLTEHLTSDVLPILGTLDRVGPDIHDLLEVTRDLKLAVAGIPGLRMLRRRGEERLADEND